MFGIRGRGGGENYNIKWSNIQLLKDDEHGRGSWNLLNARQKPEQANLLISGYPDRNSTQLQMVLWTAPLQHIRLFGIIGLLPPWPLMVRFNCHQSQRSPLFFHLIRKKTFKRKNTLVNSVGYDKPCSFTREDDKSFSTNNCVHRIDSRWHYPTTIQQINGPKRSKVSTITQLTRLKCKKRKERRSNILSNNDNAPNTKKMTYMYVQVWLTRNVQICTRIPLRSQRSRQIHHFINHHLHEHYFWTQGWWIAPLLSTTMTKNNRNRVNASGLSIMTTLNDCEALIWIETLRKKKNSSSKV